MEGAGDGSGARLGGHEGDGKGGTFGRDLHASYGVLGVGDAGAGRVEFEFVGIFIVTFVGVFGDENDGERALFSSFVGTGGLEPGGIGGRGGVGTFFGLFGRGGCRFRLGASILPLGRRGGRRGRTDRSGGSDGLFRFLGGIRRSVRNRGRWCGLDSHYFFWPRFDGSGFLVTTDGEKTRKKEYRQGTKGNAALSEGRDMAHDVQVARNSVGVDGLCDVKTTLVPTRRSCRAHYTFLAPCPGHDHDCGVNRIRLLNFRYCFAVFGIMGCATSTPSPVSQPAPTATNSESSVATPAQKTPEEQPAEPAAVATPPESGPSPFTVIGESHAEMHLQPAGNIGFLLVKNKIWTLRDDTVAYDPHPNRGLPTGNLYESVTVGGEWPDTALIRAVRKDAGRHRSELFFWDGMRWKSKLQTPAGTELGDFAPWNLRRVLALVRDIQTGKPSFQVIAGFPIAPVPVATASQEPGCATALLHERAAILRSGHVMAAGKVCAGVGIGVEHWDPGSNKGTIHSLPQSEGVRISDLVATHSSQAWIGGSTAEGASAYVASWENGAWSRQDTPMRDAIVRLATDGHGTLWTVTASGQLWKKQETRWERVFLPGDTRQIPMTAEDVWPLSSQQVWVIAKSQERRLLLYTVPRRGDRPVETLD